MCGLAGLVGLGIQSVDLDTFHDLLYMSALRGPHSTGLLTVASKNKKWGDYPEVVKRTGASPYFIAADAASKSPQLKDRLNDVFMAHCRWATVGKHTPDNAHPFDTGRYISAHNGTLLDSWSYADKGSDKTDSLLMFEKMEAEGVRPVLEGLNKNSAYAITMYDKKTRQIIIARNDLRTLCIGVSKKRDVLYWASEYAMLYAASVRNNVDLDISFVPVGKILYIDPGKVKKDTKAPWGVATLNFNPVEETTSTKRVTSSTTVDFDWGDWQEWADAQDKAGKFAEENKRMATPITAVTDREIEEEWQDDIHLSGNFNEEELAKASAHYVENAYGPPNKPPSKAKATARRSQVMMDIDKIIDDKMSIVDRLFEDVKAEQLHEAAQKAIEEAQGCTSSKKTIDRLVDNPHKHDDYGEDEECCICNRTLSKNEFMNSEACNVDGVFYYVCQSCHNDLKEEKVG